MEGLIERMSTAQASQIDRDRLLDELKSQISEYADFVAELQQDNDDLKDQLGQRVALLSSTIAEKDKLRDTVRTQMVRSNQLVERMIQLDSAHYRGRHQAANPLPEDAGQDDLFYHDFDIGTKVVDSLESDLEHLHGIACQGRTGDDDGDHFAQVATVLEELRSDRQRAVALETPVAELMVALGGAQQAAIRFDAACGAAVGEQETPIFTALPGTADDPATALASATVVMRELMAEWERGTERVQALGQRADAADQARQDSMQAVAAATAESEALRAQLAAMQAQSEEQDAAILALHDTLSKTQARSSAALRTVDERDAVIDVLQKAQEGHQARIAATETALIQARDELAIWRQRCVDSEQQREVFAAEIRTAQALAAERATTMAAALAEQAETTVALTQAHERIAHLEREQAAVTQQHDQLVQQQSEQQAQVGQIAATLAEATTTPASAGKKGRTTQASSSAPTGTTLDALAQQVGALIAERDALLRARQELECDVATQRQRFVAVESRQIAAEAQLAAAEQQAREQDDAVRALRTELVSATDRHAAITADLAAMTAERDRVQTLRDQEAEAQRAALADVQAEHAAEFARVAALTAEAVQRMEQLSALTAALSTAHANGAAAEQLVREQDDALQALRTELASATGRHAAVTADLAAMTAERDHVQTLRDQEAEAHHSALADVQAEHAAESARVAALREELAQRAEILEATQTRSAAAHEELATVRADHASAQIAMETLARDLSAAQVEGERLAGIVAEVRDRLRGASEAGAIAGGTEPADLVAEADAVVQAGVQWRQAIAGQADALRRLEAEKIEMADQLECERQAHVVAAGRSRELGALLEEERTQGGRLLMAMQTERDATASLAAELEANLAQVVSSLKDARAQLADEQAVLAEVRQRLAMLEQAQNGLLSALRGRKPQPAVVVAAPVPDSRLPETIGLPKTIPSVLRDGGTVRMASSIRVHDESVPDTPIEAMVVPGAAQAVFGNGDDAQPTPASEPLGIMRHARLREAEYGLQQAEATADPLLIAAAGERYIESALGQIAELDAVVDIQRSELADARQIGATLMERLADAESRVVEREQHIGELETSFAAASHACEQAQQRIAELDVHLTGRDQQVQALDAQVAELRQELQQAEACMAGLRAQHEEVGVTLVQAQQNLRAVASDAQAHRARADASRALAEDVGRTLHAELDGALLRLQECDTRIEDMTEQLAVAEARFAAQRAEWERLMAERDAVVVAKEGVINECRRAVEEERNLRIQVEARLAERSKDVGEVRRRMVDELAELRTRVRSLADDNRRLCEDNAGLQARIGHLLDGQG
jgi:chromosome segregation ATPase